MDSGDAHKVDVGANPRDRFGGGCANGHHRMFEQASADQFNLNTDVVHQFNSYAGAMGYDGSL